MSVDRKAQAQYVQFQLNRRAEEVCHFDTRTIREHIDCALEDGIEDLTVDELYTLGGLVAALLIRDQEEKRAA